MANHKKEYENKVSPKQYMLLPRNVEAIRRMAEFKGISESRSLRDIVDFYFSGRWVMIPKDIVDSPKI